MNNEYFGKLQPNELLPILRDKKDNFYNYLRTSGLFDLYRRAYNQYFKAGFHGGNIMAMGENAEFTGLYVNDYRNLIGQLCNITLTQRPTFQSRAVNSDFKSMAQAKLSNGLLEYYLREKRLEKFIKKAVEMASSTFGRGYISIFWDTEEGEDYGTTETGAVIKNGDIVFRNHNASDVIRDPISKSHSDCDWFIVRTWQNKYNLSNKYTQVKDDIEKLSYNISEKKDELLEYSNITNIAGETDLIPVYEFYHKKTSSVPDGRYVMYLDSDILLIDSPMPYKDIPLYSVSCGEIFGTPFDYTVGFDLLPLQKYNDILYSSAATNQKNGSVSNVLMPRGSSIGLERLTNGLNVIEYDGSLGIPQVLNLVATPPEVFTMIDRLSSKQQMLSGINNVILGNPDPSLKSGAALALIASQAYSANMPLMQSYTQLLEDLGTGIINILKDFATVPRVAMITGLSNRSYLKEFKGEDLSEINRVIVDIGSPISNTISGKLEIANNIISIPPELRDQYYNLIQTGRYENIVEGQSAELLLIKSENEKLQDGLNVDSLVTDNHVLHIREHKVLFSSPESRENPNILNNGLQHIQKHIDFLKTGDPDLLQILGEQPIQQKNVNTNNQVMNPNPAVLNQAASVNMPSMPNNPMTGQEFDPSQNMY